MKNNLSNLDRILRILSFIAVLILFITNVLTGALALILLIATSILMLTALINFCPIYAIFGISTRRTKKQ